MLEEALQLVAEGGVRSYKELATALDITESLLEQMLEDLARMGYLRRVGGDCPAECAHCPREAPCAVSGPGKLWALTEKGSALARRQSSSSGEADYATAVH